MKRLLFVSHRVPYPPDKGERVRAFHEIVALADSFGVTVATLAHDPGEFEQVSPLRRWCEKLIVCPTGGRRGLARGAWTLLRGGSVTEGYFRSRYLTKALRRESDEEPFDIVVAYSSGMLDAALDVPASARVIDLVDVDSAKWESYAEASHPPMRWIYRREARGVRALEERAMERCDAVFLVSPDEVRALGRHNSNVMPMGNGVDSEYFHRAVPVVEGPPRLVFTGTMSYRPNADGICDFVRDVWPRLLKQRPDMQLSIVGRDPTAAVRRLAAVPGVRVTGPVPDVRPFIAEATAAVVPLKIARGIQNKVLEAMSMGRAVVGSGPALEGLEVTVGEDVLRADAPDEWLTKIARIIDDAALRCRLQDNARRAVEERYNWSVRMRPLLDTCLALSEGEGMR